MRWDTPAGLLSRMNGREAVVYAQMQVKVASRGAHASRFQE